MANNIEIAEKKTLKLNNVLFRALDTSDTTGFEKTASMFESYTKSKKLDLYGPVVIRVEPKIVGREVQITTTLLGQVRNPPESVDDPYSFLPLLRVENCLMARYRGPSKSLQVAYSKMQVYAFENNIPLSGTTYTVYVDGNSEDEIMADVFTEVMQ